MHPEVVTDAEEAGKLGRAGVPAQPIVAGAKRRRKRPRSEWGVISGERHAAALLAGRLPGNVEELDPRPWSRSQRMRVLSAAVALQNPHVAQLTSASKFGADWAVYPDDVERSHATNLVFTAARGPDGALRSLSGAVMRARELVPLLRVSGQAFKDALLVIVPEREEEGEDLPALRRALAQARVLSLRYHRPLTRATGTTARKQREEQGSAGQAPDAAADAASAADTASGAGE